MKRMKKIPAMEESTEEDVRSSNGYIISTKFVVCWKHRVEHGGWFRRGRLVARHFQSSIDLEQIFAPTSMLVVPKLRTHLLLKVFNSCGHDLGHQGRLFDGRATQGRERLCGVDGQKPTGWYEA